MRVFLGSGDRQYPAKLRQISTLGAVVEGDLPQASGPTELRLEEENASLLLPGEILGSYEDGIRLAFEQLDMEKLEELERWCRKLAGHPESAKEKKEKTESPAAGELLSLSSDWSPPLREPMPHEWKPPGGLAVEKKAAARPWTELSTRVPVPPQAVTAPPSPQPPPAVPSRGEQDRRELPRQERSIPVVFDNLTSLIKEFTHNISFGGLFIFTEQPHRTGEEVAVTLIHPVSGERLTLLGRVAHSGAAAAADPISGKPRYGVGIQFRLPLEELKRVLSDFIDSRHRPAPASAGVIAEARRLLAEAEKGPRILLGVGADADEARIRRAYFELVDRFHPDRFHGKVTEEEKVLLEELFRRLTVAYESLLA